MASNVPQPDRAEGERDDEPGKPAGAGGAQSDRQGCSSQAPAEGGDDVPAGGSGAPG